MSNTPVAKTFFEAFEPKQIRQLLTSPRFKKTFTRTYHFHEVLDMSYMVILNDSEQNVSTKTFDEYYTDCRRLSTHTWHCITRLRGLSPNTSQLSAILCLLSSKNKPSSTDKECHDRLGEYLQLQP